MNLNDFDFLLPEKLIALRPVRPRTSSRLLVAKSGSFVDANFFQLKSFLRPGDRLVFNNTKVLKSLLLVTRLRKVSNTFHEAKVQINLLDKISDRLWKVLAKPLRKLKNGDFLKLSDGHVVLVRSVESNYAVIDLQYDKSSNVESFLNRTGRMPLPPYILRNRASDSDDDIDYQTIFASIAGSVAAPTASLHFDDSILSDLKDTGIDFSYLTLHVGGGTFLPIKSDNIADHLMHSEKGHISQKTAMEINQTKQAGGRIIAVGTTSARLLEAAASNDYCSPFDDETNIFIKPGYRFNLVDGLITNFHLPKSTLIMLVSALIGVEECKKLYSHAIKIKYRFYSYGDSSLLFKKS